MFSYLKTRHKILIEIIIVLFAILWIAPLATALTQSLKIQGFHNYWLILHHPKINVLLVTYNSFFISIISSLSVAILISLAAYAFSKMEFKGKNILYYALLTCLAIPPAAILAPMFITTKRLGLMNSLFAVIIPVIALQIPFMLLILKNYFDTIPTALLEAARIDGCHSFRILYIIVLPLAKPAIVNVLVLTFINAWNEYLIPLLFIRKTQLYTVTLASTYFTGAMHQTPADLAQQYAALVLITVPSVLVYIFCQKYLQAGLTAGAVKS